VCILYSMGYSYEYSANDRAMSGGSIEEKYYSDIPVRSLSGDYAGNILNRGVEGLYPPKLTGS